MSRHSSKILPLFRGLALAATVASGLWPASAQESITVLPAPQGESSGATLPTEQGGNAAAPAAQAGSEAAAADATPAPPPPCGTQPLTMARMQWPTAALLTEIHA